MTRQDVSITARFTLPVLDPNGNNNDDDGMNDKGDKKGDCYTIEERWDEKNCSEALMGLPPGTELTKVR